jgi:hypothetical protein
LVVFLQLTAVDAFTFFDQATQKQLWLLTNKPQHFWWCSLRLPACFVVLVVAAVVAVVAAVSSKRNGKNKEKCWYLVQLCTHSNGGCGM